MEAIPVLSDRKSENMVLSDYSESWIQLKDEFCLLFFPVPKVIPHRIQLLTFEQGDNDSLGAAWARFTHLATSGPPHKIDEEMLMQHFIYGLNPESERFLNLASEGSVMYKTMADVRTILEKVLNSTQYTDVFDDPPELEVPPTERQPLHILSVVSSPPPPHIEEITKPPKSLDHEPLLEDMLMFVPDLFSEEEYIELSHISNMPKEHNCIC